MDEAQFFTRFVGAITLVTAARAACAPQPFLMACLPAQAIALAGLLTHEPSCIKVAHVGFTTAVGVGALVAHGLELYLVAFLLAFTLATRRALGHCMFAHARGSADTNDARYDLVYLTPLAIAAWRLASSRDGAARA